MKRSRERAVSRTKLGHNWVGVAAVMLARQAGHQVVELLGDQVPGEAADVAGAPVGVVHRGRCRWHRLADRRQGRTDRVGHRRILRFRVRLGPKEVPTPRGLFFVRRCHCTTILCVCQWWFMPGLAGSGNRVECALSVMRRRVLALIDRAAHPPGCGVTTHQEGVLCTTRHPSCRPDPASSRLDW